ncbi:MDR family oxidoreductase [Corynebacterium caspium]|uniref:MDR family oxidoreductase n=1 Tax=Corynebacterium caspium TaxID=234828 RepID=UPI0003772884|nr:MDR family oxidoreductase [Corynebacterium caspium]WKD58458.1 Acrylyl-CoA reductase AcuI [Corynebacterium caspium DSM 44850]
MTTSARALLVTKDEAGTTTSVVAETSDYLGTGDLLIDVTYSSLNYKDGMALAANPGVARILPLVPGIDAVGTVLESDSLRFKVGDKVLINGAGLGENRHGGFSTKLRIPAAATIHLPKAFSLHDAAAIGTAGFTAALCVDALLAQGCKPEDGEILITGATGGVGSIGLHLLHQLGFRTVALTGRVAELGDYLRSLGADEILDRASFAAAGKPLQKARFAGVLDTVGSHILVNAIAQTIWGGTVTACGLAQGADLPGTVLPFILRAVKLVGINSVDAPLALRIRAWQLLAKHLDPAVLATFTETLPLSQAAAAGTELLAGKRHGRVVIDTHA